MTVEAPVAPRVLAGDLRHFHATEVLQLLKLAGASGCLALEREGERVEVSFERGRPLMVRSSGRSVRTGEVLMHRAGLSAAQLEQALEDQRRDPGKRVGRLLVERGWARREDVILAIHEAAKRIVYGVALWRDGRFWFDPEARVVADDLAPALELERLILEGLRLADEADVREA